MTPVKKYPLYSPLFWKEYVVQMRPYLLFVSGIAGAAGMAMSKTETTETWKQVIAFFPFFMGYGFGQAFTDCFQTDTDKLSAPYRPLSKEIVSIKAVLFASLTGLVFCAAIFYLLHWISFLLSGLAVFGIATYSYVKRNITFAGPFYNAWIIALLPLMGYYSLADSGTDSFPSSYIPFILITFFSYASFVLIGYLKDINADQATGYKTIPVVWGWNKTMLIGDVFALATLALFWFSTSHNRYETIPGILASLLIIYGQCKGHFVENKNEEGSLDPILATVRSFVLFHIAIIMHFQPVFWPFTIVYYVLFEIFLYKRPSLYQI
ncbi:MAG TPA: UbiA family prenyltransferase [Chitinophagaceae bacterium]|nr:UbiA family prenyltransferase [Chitinophagaceae bacterium]